MSIEQRSLGIVYHMTMRGMAAEVVYAFLGFPEYIYMKVLSSWNAINFRQIVALVMLVIFSTSETIMSMMSAMVV